MESNVFKSREGWELYIVTDGVMVGMGELCLVMWCTHHVTRHIMPIHNILSTSPQWSISQKALGTLPDYCNVMPKYVGATIHN
jgi:hypothetical protein